MNIFILQLVEYTEAQSLDGEGTDCTYQVVDWIVAHMPNALLCPSQGEYQILLELYNENRATVACANATVISS